MHRLSAAYIIVSKIELRLRSLSIPTYLLVGREYRKAGARRLVLVRSPESPKGNWSATELSEPALQFRLGRIMGQAAKMKDLAPLGKKGSDIGMGVHRTGENLGVLVRRLRFADQAPKHPGKSYGFLHGAAR